MVVGGIVVPRPMMYVALTYDHRLIDGREAVYFLRRIKDVVEDPQRLLLDIWWQKDSGKTDEITSLLVFVSFTDLLSEEKKNWTTFSSFYWAGKASVYWVYLFYIQFEQNVTILTKIMTLIFIGIFTSIEIFFCQLPVSLDQVIIKLKYIFQKTYLCLICMEEKNATHDYVCCP